MEEKRKIVQVNSGRRIQKQDLVATEIALTIWLNRRKYFYLPCSPEHLKYLVTGLLFTSGIITSKSEISKMEMRGYHCHVEIEKARFRAFEKNQKQSPALALKNIPGKSWKIKNSPVTISAKKVQQLVAYLQKYSRLFLRTGCLHAAGLAKDGQLICLHEDVGRHNAIDKVVGECVMKDMDMSDKILLFSGRMSAEIVLKTCRAGIPIVVSPAPPTSRGVEIAEKQNITLIGFARGNRFNVYSHWKRLEND